MTDIPNIFDFEKTVGMTYLEAVEYLKKINLWERNRKYSGYEIVSTALYYRNKKRMESQLRCECGS